jgi:sorting nexin-1/2
MEQLQIQVTAPEKVGEGIMSAHVEYKLTVKTTLPQLKSGEFEVVRRYKDFVWLREQLCEKQKGYLIPPLPEKALLNRFNAEFLEFRRRELERFLHRISVHPVLSHSPELHKFLESTEPLSDTPKSPPTKKEGGGSSSGLFSFLGTSIESISSNFGAQSEPDQWFDAKKNYFNSLESHLTALAKATSQITKKRKELSQCWSEFGLASSLLASSEADQDQWLSNSFNRIHDITSQVTALDEKVADDQTAFFEDNIRDYIRVLGSVKEMLAVRGEKLFAYQNATKQLEMKKEKLDKAKPASIKSEKEIEEAEKRMEDAKEEFNKISEVCKSELQRFEATKLQDIKSLLIKLTQININHDLLVIDQWKGLLQHLLDNKSS